MILPLGGGTVVDIKPLHHKKRTEKIINSLTDLVEATLHSDKIINLVKIELNKVNAPVYASDIALKINKPVELIIEEINTDDKRDILFFDENQKAILLRSNLDATYFNFILEEINSWHLKNPILAEGLETIEFIGKLGFGNNEAGKRYLELLMVTDF